MATALAAKVSFSTGLILPNTICITSEGTLRTVVEYRPPQKTALWLEGSEDALHVPLPGLLMIRTANADRNPEYQIHAVAERPTTMDAALYRVPLPNIDHGGGVCWGTVTKVKPKKVNPNHLVEDWSQLLDTPFGNHSVNGKSATYTTDIRKLLIALDKRRARAFPKKELVPEKRTLGKVLALPVDDQDWADDDDEGGDE